MSEKNFRSKAEVEAFYEVEQAEPAAPLTFKERIVNFWYYYKWHTIIIAFIAFVLIFGFAQCATKENPDYTVITAFDKYIPLEVTSAIEGELEKYAEDINGDGKVIVHIYDVSTATDHDTQMAQSTKLMSELQRGEVMLLIVDDVYYDKLGGLDVFEALPEYFPDKDNTALNLLDSDLTDIINEAYAPLAVANYGKEVDFISGNYYIAKRVIAGTSYEKVEKSIMSEQNNLKMLRKFIDSLEFKD